MSLSHSPAPPPPSRVERAEQRRAQVVQAARECFRRYGFHAASMAQIATAAGMSVGQIYRFFAGKEAIIQAIVEEGVVERLDHIAAMEAAALESGRDLADVSADDKETASMDDRAEAALMLEIAAEAARNPAIAAIVEENDRKVRERVEQMISAARPHWPAERVADTVRMITAMHEGWFLRIIHDPDARWEAQLPLRSRLVACALQS